jgi:intracellular sulfur oxidation DsrE/DsrF family protein
MPNKFTLTFILIFFNLFATPISFATDQELEQAPGYRIENVLAMQQAPAGVVIEIVTGAENSLNWALPLAQKHIKKLRARFPKLEIAIVTHGSEQFSLTSNNNKKYQKVHSLTQQLAKEVSIPLHVCGTYASWNNVSEEDFPEYVDVTAAGPATINDYIALGYLLIKL